MKPLLSIRDFFKTYFTLTNPKRLIGSVFTGKKKIIKLSFSVCSVQNNRCARLEKLEEMARNKRN